MGARNPVWSCRGPGGINTCVRNPHDDLHFADQAQPIEADRCCPTRRTELLISKPQPLESSRVTCALIDERPANGMIQE